MERQGHEFSLAMLNLKCHWNIQIDMFLKKLEWGSGKKSGPEVEISSDQSSAEYWSHEKVRSFQESMRRRYVGLNVTSDFLLSLVQCCLKS